MGLPTPKNTEQHNKQEVTTQQARSLGDKRASLTCRWCDLEDASWSRLHLLEIVSIAISSPPVAIWFKHKPRAETVRPLAFWYQHLSIDLFVPLMHQVSTSLCLTASRQDRAHGLHFWVGILTTHLVLAAKPCLQRRWWRFRWRSLHRRKSRWRSLRPRKMR